ELQRTYDAQREAQMRRQQLERETAAANMQAEVVRSEQQVRIQEMVSEARVAAAKGEAESAKVRALAEAEVQRVCAAATYKAGIDALGEQSYTAVQMASILGSAGMKLVPDVVLGEGRGNLADVLLAKMATGRTAAPELAPTNGHNGTKVLAVADDVEVD